MREVMRPTVRALAAEGTPYVGFLYAGLMIAADGTPKVLEFNCRFGDPETQPILARMRSDITQLCDAALDGRLASASVRLGPARRGRRRAGRGRLPGRRPQGRRHPRPRRSGEAARQGFPRRQRGSPASRSSRTAAACCAPSAWATTSAPRSGRPTTSPRPIRWDGMQYRRDIGHRAIDRE